MTEAEKLKAALAARRQLDRWRNQSAAQVEKYEKKAQEFLNDLDPEILGLLAAYDEDELEDDDDET